MVLSGFSDPASHFLFVDVVSFCWLEQHTKSLYRCLIFFAERTWFPCLIMRDYCVLQSNTWHLILDMLVVVFVGKTFGRVL